MRCKNFALLPSSPLFLFVLASGAQAVWYHNGTAGTSIAGQWAALSISGNGLMRVTGNLYTGTNEDEILQINVNDSVDD